MTYTTNIGGSLGYSADGDPRALEVQYDDGLQPVERSRIHVQWMMRNDHTYHYTDSEGVDLRWGRHPDDGDDIQLPAWNTITHHQRRPPTHLPLKKRVSTSDRKHSSHGP